MILADKIIQLRKKNGWSQEELADKMGVSRQSVSKWEGAQSVPDLDKVLLLGKLFGVSTDFLLKDEMEEIEFTSEDPEPDGEAVRRVSMEEANSFLSIKAQTAKQIAFAVFLCILSPICLLLLGAGSETGIFSMSENVAGGLGIIILLLFVTPAVAVFISTGIKTSRFNYLERQIIELEYGVAGMAKERMKKYRDTYTLNNTLATCLCILSVVPLFICSLFTESDFIMASSICMLLLIAGIGVFLFILTGINQESMKKLLQEDEYSKTAKANKKKLEAFSSIYWLCITACYLAFSFITDKWDTSWIIWPVAGVLYGAIATAINAFRKGN